MPGDLKFIGIIILQLILFFDVWIWYFKRITDFSDEPVGIVALITAILVIFSNLKTNEKNTPTTFRELLLPGVLILFYLLTYNISPPMLKAILAFLSISITFTNKGVKEKHGIAGLFILSLPVISSLQFYLGYPLRFLSAWLIVPLLGLNGIFVELQGTCVKWNSQIICIDAPCSGIKMLWTGFYLTFTIVCLFKSDLIKTIILSLFSFIVIIFGNTLRASSLFYLESGILPLPSFFHEGIGLSTFMIVSILIIYFAKYLKNYLIIKNFPNIDKYSDLIITLFIFIITIPFILENNSKSKELTFHGWPKEFEGKKLVKLPLSEIEKSFESGFPGHISRFSDGQRKIILRWISKKTRKLHPSSDCFKGLGYGISFNPVYIDHQKNYWNSFDATRNSEKFTVYERIFKETGASWSDVSSWYWSKSEGPWWSITITDVKH